MNNCHHYPAANQEPALTALSHFLWSNLAEALKNKKRLVLGNGASELIDLVTRLAMPGPFQSGPFDIQV